MGPCRRHFDRFQPPSSFFQASVSVFSMNRAPLGSISQLSLAGLLAEAQLIVESIEQSWRKGREYKYTLETGRLVAVQLYAKDNLNGDFWVSRVNEFKEFSGAEKAEIHKDLVKYVVGSLDSLQNTHTEFEKQYVHEVHDYKLQEIQLENGNYATHSYLAKVYYHFQFPLSKRVFYEVVHIVKAKDDSWAYVISLPVVPEVTKATASDRHFTTGTYASLERFVYDKEKESLKWSMCTSSSPGGFIPDWLTNRSVGAAVAKDVPNFLNWSKKFKKSQK